MHIAPMYKISILFRWVTQILYSASTVAVFTILFMQFRQTLPLQIVTLLYLVPVVISSALWGMPAGITASVLSFLLYNYYFIPPYHTLRVSHPQDFISMFVLLGVAVLISSLMARIQSHLQQAQAREREALLLSQYSLDLTVQKDAAAICHVLANHLNRFFPGSIVAIELSQTNDNLRIASPENTPLPAGPPTKWMVLNSPRGELGHIAVWIDPGTGGPEMERLLQTIANQGAMALDRADLLEAQTRARVAEESDRLKTAILSSVSHELRTPLASIQASATSLFTRDVDFEPDARAELQSLLLEEINHMIQLVGNLLNMSRIEAGALKLQRQWNSLAEIVDHSMQPLRRISGNHRFDVDVSEDLPLVAVDSVLMEQVIINLVRNSLRFSPPNSAIEVHAYADDQLMWVTITNPGPAISDEYIDRIFDKFFPMPGRDPSLNLGLGLSICKGVIDAHGGKIWAENLANGVAFRFTIPLDWKGSQPVIPNEEREET